MVTWTWIESRDTSREVERHRENIKSKKKKERMKTINMIVNVSFVVFHRQQATKKMVHSISFIQSKSFGTKHYTKYTQAFKQTNKQKQNMVEIERERETYIIHLNNDDDDDYGQQKKKRE